MPVSSAYRPDPLFEPLGGEFADAVIPARFPAHILRFRNDRWARRVGLEALDDGEWENHFARFDPLPDNIGRPLAMRYHGHQFRVYNPKIGDGRGFLFAQLRDDRGRLLDLATKGSGQTPYSRFGDGRLTLKGGVREILAAEMLEALGVETSKAFSLYETGESLQRSDEPSPTRSSVLVRRSHSHIRFGTFQRLVFFERPDLIRILIDHVAQAYYPHLLDVADAARPAGLLRAAVDATARLAGRWMAAGFVHGVLNTDNMTVTGESFDYGPWRFLPQAIPGFTAAYFDEIGLYAYARQPESASWNLAQLAGCLTLVSDTPPLEEALRGFPAAYQAALRDAIFARLGLRSGELAPDVSFVQALFSWMTESGVGFQQFFHDWFCGQASAARAAASSASALYAASAFDPVRAGIETRESVGSERLADPYFARPGPTDMVIEEVESLWADIAGRDDWTAFNAKIADVRAMGAALRLAST
jgi:uncharacterized protein YdiU (UPF0061 family)